MIAVFNQCADGVAQTAQGQVYLLRLLQPLPLHLALEDLLAACKVDQIELALYRLAIGVDLF